MKILHANSRDIVDISKLHKQYIASESSRLGEKYLQILYEAMIKDAGTIGIVAKENDAVIGVLFATINLRNTQKKITRALIPFGIPIIFFALIRGNITIMELFQRIQFESRLNILISQPAVMIMTLFVVPRYRRTGIGKQLMQALLMEIKKHHFPYVFVNTHIDNSVASSFYKRFGFKEVCVIGNEVVYKIDKKIAEKE